MALPTKLTLTAGLGRIYSHPRTGDDRLKTSVQRIGTAGLHNAGELMAENQRASDAGVSNAGIGVGVQIAAAQSRDQNTQEDLAWPRRTRMRDPVDPEVRWPVQSRRKHATAM